jgi:protein-tyrosine phosphatase
LIDIHSHILPGVDDGAKSWDTAVEMCRMAAADGIEHMVATPHANDRYPYQREKCLRLLDELRQRVGPSPALTLGCDFHFSYENLQSLRDNPGGYTVGNTQYLLVELSDFSIPPQLDDSLLRLGDLGLIPVITHPERNTILQQNLGRVLYWAEQGCVVQVTGSSLTGSWGERAQRAAQKLLECDAVHILASDSHDVDHRKPILSEARDVAAEIAGPDAASSLVDDNPRAIIEGKPLPYFPEPVVRG